MAIRIGATTNLWRMLQGSANSALWLFRRRPFAGNRGSWNREEFRRQVARIRCQIQVRTWTDSSVPYTGVGCRVWPFVLLARQPH